MASRAAAVLQERVPMGLRIPPEFERAVLDRVASGRYETAEDVFKACLEALSQLEADEAGNLDWLREQVEIGIAELDRGEGLPGEEVMAQIRARFKKPLQTRADERRTERVRVDVPAEVHGALMRRVASGEYTSTDEILKLCLELLEQEEASEAQKLEMLQRDVQHAMDQYDRGEYSPAEEVFARLHARLQRSSAP